MKKIIIGNLKMNIISQAERSRYLESFRSEIEKNTLEDTEVALCVPAMHIEKYIEELSEHGVAIGAQNILMEDRGSYTGENSPLMIKNFGAKYSLVGHSERRRFFGETNRVARDKIKACIRNSLKSVYCIGETKEQRDLGQTNVVLEKQITEALTDIPHTKGEEVVIAYEPIWAVGTDIVPASDSIMEVKIYIRKVLSKLFGNGIASKMKVLYGGSVNTRNIEKVCVEPGMDGVLVGRESLIPVEFLKMAKILDSVDKN